MCYIFQLLFDALPNFMSWFTKCSMQNNDMTNVTVNLWSLMKNLATLFYNFYKDFKYYEFTSSNWVSSEAFLLL